MTFWHSLKRLSLSVALTLASGASLAQADFPNRPIRMLVGFSAGSISDATARLLADRLKDELGQPVVIENLPGAGATLAAGRAAKAPADGYALLFVAMGHAVAPALYNKLPYDTLADFTGVATVADARVMLVTHPKHRFKSVVELIADAKRKPGHYTYGSSGNGTFLHLIAESLAQSTGAQLVHVPYRSGAAAVNSVIAGEIDLAFCTINTCLEQVASGRLLPLGYIAQKRHAKAPQIPTFAELGLAFDVGSYNYVLAPSATPKPVLRKLHAAINKSLQSAAFQDKLMSMGLEPLPSESPEAVSAFVKSEVDRWGQLVRSIGLTID